MNIVIFYEEGNKDGYADACGLQKTLLFDKERDRFVSISSLSPERFKLGQVCFDIALFPFHGARFNLFTVINGASKGKNIFLYKREDYSKRVKIVYCYPSMAPNTLKLFKNHLATINNMEELYFELYKNDDGPESKKEFQLDNLLSLFEYTETLRLLEDNSAPSAEELFQKEYTSKWI